LKEAGFRCLVPSALGYCGSSQPEALEAYGFQAQSNDLEELLKHIGVEGKILLFGHDWYDLRRLYRRQSLMAMLL
jgi:soluble epoxide hydrolase/lipid-phosphate phosphatase